MPAEWNVVSERNAVSLASVVDSYAMCLHSNGSCSRSLSPFHLSQTWFRVIHPEKPYRPKDNSCLLPRSLRGNNGRCYGFLMPEIIAIKQHLQLFPKSQCGNHSLLVSCPSKLAFKKWIFFFFGYTVFCVIWALLLKTVDLTQWIGGQNYLISHSKYLCILFPMLLAHAH